MSAKTEQAIDSFLQGLNCSQAVLSVFAKTYGLDSALATKIACGFGAGLREGEVCGAVSGAAMVIGLKYGNEVIQDRMKKAECNEKIKEFTRIFKDKNNAIVCRDLLACDLSTEEGYEYAMNNGLFETTCVDMVKSAIEILEELGY